jgi:molecular chaperone GrpE
MARPYGDDPGPLDLDEDLEESGPASAGAVGERVADAGVRELEERLEAATAEAAAAHDKYVRTVAESENFKKRMQREKADAVRFAVEGFARDLIPVLDSLELAVAHAPKDGAARPVVEGIQMTLKLFKDVLERHGIREFEVRPGSPFDPNLHEASGTRAEPGTAPNTVLEQLQKGYSLHERLLRPARVLVAAAAAEPRH